MGDPNKSRCCVLSPESGVFTLCIEGLGACDGSPLAAYFDDIIGVSQGTEVTRPLPSTTNECLAPRSTVVVGMVGLVE